MARKINYDNWSKDELIKELRRIKDTKYGLVWHRDLPAEKIDILINPDARTPNEMFPNEMAGRPFPILKEVKSKEIKSDKKSPVNLLIEGDNYHSLAVLNFTHQNKIDVIYIDPPYNIGNKDFRYNDNFVEKDDPWRHSKWLSFMEKRLRLARRLLKDTGVIFISIDDNEQAQLKLLCDEIFGEKNAVGPIIWEKKYSPANDSQEISSTHDFILVYAKNKQNWKMGLFERTDAMDKRYKNNDNDPRGPWKAGGLSAKTYSASYDYEIETPSGRVVRPPDGKSWNVSKEKFAEMVRENSIYFGVKDDSKPQKKQFLSNVKDGSVPKSIWLKEEAGHNQIATTEQERIFGKKMFDSPKPILLMQRVLQVASSQKNITVLDFFAGSGTTGHAVLELNARDGGNRQFILCTNNENNICTNVCYPRLKRIIKGYKSPKEENIAGLGGNLKYYKTDFVEAEPTDRNKRKLVNESAEMLCIREKTFDLVRDENDFKIFKNNDKYLGIVFYEEAIDGFKKAIKKIKGHFDTYVFSLGDDPHEKQFVDVKNKVTLCAIPEVILKVYREIFK